MIVRIVKMHFKKDKTDEFIELFKKVKPAIEKSNGCNHLELLREKQGGDIFFTYSIWADEADLENYRNSALFRETWNKTKALFQEKAEAWSTENI